MRTRRDSKAGLSFVHVHDGSCQAPIQVVAPQTLANYDSEVKRLTAGCSVVASGVLAMSQGQGQTVELVADAIEVVGWVDDPEAYPIQPKKTSFEYLREVAHLRPRSNTIGAMARIRHCLSQAIHRYFHERGFFWVHTPIITTSDAEGAGEMFRVSTLDLANAGSVPRGPDGRTDFGADFFGKEAFLTVSGQLNVESYCCALSKVYTFGPTFRAENSNTSRHLAEFWMIEPGIGEIIGGSQREERLDRLDARLAEMKLDPAAYWWYRDLRRYGTVPHAGFGLGLERTLIYATGTANIRDVIPFPRTPGHAAF